MESIFIARTKSTPEVSFDPVEGVLSLEGESYPDNSFQFYKPIQEMVLNYLEEESRLNMKIKLNYLNTSSTKLVMNLLDVLEEAYQSGKDVVINWYYESDNEHAYEVAQEFKEYMELPFNIIVEL